MPAPVDQQYIDKAERRLKVAFPPEYLDRMRGDNGGTVANPTDGYRWNLLPFFDESDDAMMDATYNDIVSGTENARMWRTFPDDGVSIADDIYGNRLLLLPAPDDSSRLGSPVYEWNHETGDITPIADSFTELDAT